MKKTKIIFDMDGVLTSEQMYWNCAALTVYEARKSRRYFGNFEIDTKWAFDNVKQIRSTVFCDDKIIMLLKDLGVNSNWDLAYVVLAGALWLDTDDYTKVYELYREKNLRAPEIYDFADEMFQKKLGQSDCSRSSKLWHRLMMLFQEWYYGDEYYRQQYGEDTGIAGKQGFMRGEMPMFSIEKTEKLLKTLREKGVTLGIGTGRCGFEIFTPLKIWGLDKYFDKNHCFTYDKITEAEAMLGTFLAKPNPFTFLKAVFGEDSDSKSLAEGNYDKEHIKEVLIVGDAGADLFAAKAMGADFVAVLTGVKGKGARAFFEENKAEYILDSVLEIAEKIKI